MISKCQLKEATMGTKRKHYKSSIISHDAKTHKVVERPCTALGSESMQNLTLILASMELGTLPK